MKEMTINTPDRMTNLAIFFYGKATHYKRRAMMYKVFYKWQRFININS